MFSEPTTTRRKQVASMNRHRLRQLLLKQRRERIEADAEKSAETRKAYWGKK